MSSRAALRLFIRPTIPLLPVPRVCIRCTHSTPVVLGKNKRVSSSQRLVEEAEDEVIVENPIEEDLFSSATTSSIPKRDPTTTSTSRTEAFQSLYALAVQRLARRGRKLESRRNVFHDLCAAADTKEHLEMIIELAATYRNSAIPLSTNDIFGRCITLGHPELILVALQNRPKYGLDVTSLEWARTILNALAMPKMHDPLAGVADCLDFAALYPLFGFPQASRDFVSSVILAGVIAQAKMKDSKSPMAEHCHVKLADVSFPQILEELKAAAALWDRSISFKREARWLRRSMDAIILMARREKHIQPWLLDLESQIRDI